MSDVCVGFDVPLLGSKLLKELCVFCIFFFQFFVK